MFTPSTTKLTSAGVFGAVIMALCILLTAPGALAQTDYGTIAVVINPPTSNITVELTDERKSIRECITKADGRCAFTGLEAGTYTVSVRDSTNRIPDFELVLMPGQSMTRGVDWSPLEMKGIDVVAVRTADEQAAKPNLVDQLIPGRRGERVKASQLEELSNRNQGESTLFEEQPGAFSSDNTNAFGGFTFNGQPGSQNVIRENGLNKDIIVRSSASFQDTNALFMGIKDRQSIKAYSTFSLDTNNTPAYFGTGTGGQLASEIKSAKEKISGEVYEYLANDALSARNFFDFARKPSLRFNLFGFNLGGGYKKKLFGFVNYEGIRASSGNTIYAAAPKLSLAPQADPAVAPLLNSFRAGGAFVVPGASPDDNLDVLQLDTKNLARKNSLKTRIDYVFKPDHSLGFIYSGSRSEEDIPNGLAGRRNLSVDTSHRSIFTYDGIWKEKLTTQFIFGVISEPARVFARDSAGSNADLSRSAISIKGEITPIGIPDRPSPMGIAVSGGLLRGDFDGRSMRLTPRQISFVDQMVWQVKSNHTLTFGGEVRLLRTGVEQTFGTTYKFATLADFLANRASVDHSGDLGSFTGNIGSRQVAQQYYIAYLQDAWQIKSNLLLTFGLRYEYYTILREEQDRAINLDITNGTLLPAGTPLYTARKNNFLPRVAVAWAPNWDGKKKDFKYAPTLFSSSFGMYIGPDVFNNILSPVTSDRLRVSGAGQAFPINPATLIAAANPENAEFRPRVLARDYTSPGRVYKFDFTVKQNLLKSIVGEGEAGDVLKEMFFTLAYIGSRSRNLLLRNFGNRIVSVETNADPTQPVRVKRELDIERGTDLLRPYGELEYLTTGGRANFDSFQATLNGRLKQYLQLLQVSYTLAQSRGNTDGDDAITAGYALDYDYDYGYSAADMRQKLTFGTVFSIDCERDGICANGFLTKVLNNFTVATIGTFQSGLPIDVRIKRPDVVYIDQTGNVFGSPAVGRRAVLNVPGGGSSIAAYRPDLIPGVNPYLNEDRKFLNPAAFSIPVPGRLGNLSRGALRGPGQSILDLSVSKKFKRSIGDYKTELSFNFDFTNVLNHSNFKSPPAQLEPVLGTDVSANQLQPGQPFTEAAATTFGILDRTYKRKADLGSSRQLQFGVSFKF